MKESLGLDVSVLNPPNCERYWLSSEIDYYAEYCTISKIFVNSGGNDRWLELS